MRTRTHLRTTCRSNTKVLAPIEKGGVQDLSRDTTFLKLRTIANAAKGSSWKSTIS